MSDFRDRILRLASAADLKIADVTAKTAQIEFGFDHEGEETSQIVWVRDYDDTWEFSCLSFFNESDVADFPKIMLVYALQQNAKMKLGFWCLEKMNSGNTHLEYMDNHKASLIDSTEFGRICWNTARQVDKLEQMARGKS